MKHSLKIGNLKLKIPSRKRLAIIALVIIIIVTPIIILTFKNIGKADAAWFNDNWGYRKSIAISNSSGGTLSNFQVKILDNKDLSVDITAGKIKSDLGDLRFTDINGKLLPYWIEDTTTSSVDAWILIPTVPTSGATIYMYYGNPSAVNANNIKGMTTGGTVTTISGYRIHTFINSRTFTAGPITNVDYLVVGGGGGGGGAEAHPDGDAAGGGGGGGYREGTNFSVTNQSYNVTVGIGGNGATSSSTDGTNGGNSIFSTITATGGGYGAKEESTGGAGGSGGGGGGTCGAGSKVGGNGNTPSTTPSQGYNGGTGVYDGCYSRGGAGGGGSSTVGANNISGGGGGNGGTGTTSTITGSSVARAGGGGGGMGYDHGGAGVGVGQAGGGNGGIRPYGAGNNATSNSGSGGGGGGSGSNIGGNGGSGIVIIRYAVATEPSAAAPTNEEKSPGPIAYWKFDEGTGTVAKDSSSNGLNGTLSGATLPTWQTENQCISGKCLFFDGSSSYTSINSMGTFTKTGQYTLSAWVKPTIANSTTHMIFSLTGNSNNIVFNIQQSANNKLMAQTGKAGVGGDDAEDTSTITVGNWYHVVGVFTGSQVKLYVNGILKTTTNYNNANTATDNSSGWNIGKYIENGTSYYYWKGQIDDVKIYKYARTIAQIKTDYASRGSVKGVSAQIGGSDVNKNLSNGLVGFWKMDETTTPSLDSSGNGNSGTWAGNTAVVSGKFSNGTTYDGSGDYVNIGEVNGLLDFSNNLSISFWMNPDSLSTNYTRILGKASGGSWENGYAFTTRNNTFAFWVNGQTNVAETASIPSVGIWHHIIGVYDHNKIRLYIDGVEAASTSYTQNVVDTALNFRIGSLVNGGNADFDGKIDDVRVYNRALSPAEVSQLYNFAPGPIAYWNFEEGQGNSINDTSGNGNTGTWNGTGTSHWSSGKYGNAGKFNGTDDYVNATNVNLGLNGAGSVSTGGWYYINTIAQDQRLIQKQISDGWNSFALLIQSDGKIQWTPQNSSLSQFPTWVTSNAITQGWHHIFATFNKNAIGSTDGDIYIDGIKQATTYSANSYSSTFTIQESTNNLVFGTRPVTINNFFNGRIDEIKIYNYTRTAKQIVSDMNAGHPNVGSPVGSAIGHWKFDEGFGAITNNSGNGGNALKGTLYSTTWRNEGKFGKALVFNGAASYVDTPQPTQFSKNSFTNSFWLNISNSALSQSILSEGAWGAGGRGWGIDFYSADTWWGAKTGYINFSYQFVGGGTIAIAKCNYAGYQNKWVHITAVRDFNAQTAALYLNGNKCESNYYSDMQSTETNDYQTSLKIGRTSWIASGYLNGIVDEVKTYSYALTADEVKLDYNHGATQILGSMSDTSGLAGGSVASNSASAAYCVPGDTLPCGSPVGEWNFEEGNGTTTYDTTGSNNLTLINSPKWTTGKIGKAVNYTYTSTQYSTSASPTNLPTGSVMTVEAWIYPLSIQGDGTYNGIVSWGNRGCTGTAFLMSMQSNGRPSFATWCNDFVPGSGATFNFNQWNHYAAVLNGTSIILYVNGVAINGTVSTPNIGTGPLNIGSTDNPGRTFNGKIDGVKIFNYARTPAQVAYDYNRGASVGYWKFDECQGTTINDSSGNSNVGTINGSTALGTCADGTNTTKWSKGSIGKFNSSLYFNGTDDIIALGASTPVAKSNLITVTAWIKPTGSNSRIVNRGWCNQYGWLMHESLGFGVNNSTGCSAQYWASFGTITAGNWYFLTGIFDGSKVYAYKNGVLMNQLNAPSVDLSQNNYSLNMMANEGGQLDEVRIYNYVLTKQQIQQVMNQGAGVRFGPNTGTP